MKTKNSLTINKMLFQMFLDQNANKTCGEVFVLSGSDVEYSEAKIADLDLIRTLEYIQLNNRAFKYYLCSYSYIDGKFMEFSHDDMQKGVNILDLVKFEDAI